MNGQIGMEQDIKWTFKISYDNMEMEHTIGYGATILIGILLSSIGQQVICRRFNDSGLYQSDVMWTTGYNSYRCNSLTSGYYLITMLEIVYLEKIFGTINSTSSINHTMNRKC